MYKVREFCSSLGLLLRLREHHHASAPDSVPMIRVVCRGMLYLAGMKPFFASLLVLKLAKAAHSVEAHQTLSCSIRQRSVFLFKKDDDLAATSRSSRPIIGKKGIRCHCW